jgi:hypothetical protein
MKTENTLSALRKTFLPAGATAALMLAAGIVHADPINVFSVTEAGVTPSETDNDYVRIADAIAGAVDNDTIILHGNFDLSEPFAADALPWFGFYINELESVTISGDSGASITKDWLESWEWEPMFYVQDNNNVTFSGLTVSGSMNAFFFTGNNTNMTFEDMHVVIGAYAGAPNNYPITQMHFTDGSNVSGMVIRGSIFETIANGNSLRTTENEIDIGVGWDGRGIWFRPGINLSDTLIEDNQFIASLDPALTEDPALIPAGADPNANIANTRFSFIFDNSNSGTHNITVHNNVFDGGVEYNGQTYPTVETAIVWTSKSGEYYDPVRPHSVTWTGNTFQNTLGAVNNAFNWDPNTPEHVLVLRDTTFTNVGFDQPNAPQPWNDMRKSASFAGRQAFRNMRQFYGAAGPKKLWFEFPLTIDGNQDIEALHYIASEGLFDSIDDGEGGFAEAGILAAKVIPEVAVTYDPDFTGLPWFSAPMGDTTLAIGYNAIGDELEPGDPEEIDNTYADGDVILIPEGGTFAVAPGSVIRKELTFRTDRSKSAGPSANAGTIIPTNPDFSGPLFLVEDGGTLNLDDVIISGNSPSFSGNRNVLRGLNFDGPGSATLTNTHLRDFVDAAVETENGGRVFIHDSIISDSDIGVRTRPASEVVVEGSLLEGLNLPINTRGGASAAFNNNWFRGNGGTTLFSTSHVTNLEMTGNLFFQQVAMSFNGTSKPSGTVDISGNWHSNIFAAGADEANGFVTGSVAARNSITPVVDGVRGYGSDGDGLPILEETNIVAQFDRDGDGLPDVIEMAIGSNFQSADTSGNGIPDGVHYALGIDVNSTDVPGSWTGDSFTEDTNDSGYTDWYELALATFDLDATLGDVNGTGSISLADAIRALQYVNGAVSPVQVANPNAINVIGGNVNSLGNPLQILRYQAGVRSTFPALTGIE